MFQVIVHNTLDEHEYVRQSYAHRLFDPELLAIIDNEKANWERARPPLGRWFYCKGCEKNVQPKIGPDFSIVICTECGWGLAPADGVIKAGGLQAWWAGVVADFEAYVNRAR